MLTTLITYELQFLHLLQDAMTPFWSVFWTIVTQFGEGGIFWIALTVILMIVPKTRKAGFSMAIALTFGLIVGNGIVKNVAGRIRPYDLDPTLSIGLAWGEMSKDFAFPSGHTLASFEAAFALFLRHRKWGVGALVLAVLVGVSRLFLRVHYPTDVLAGALMGILFAYLASLLVDFLWKKIPEWKNNRKKAA